MRAGLGERNKSRSASPMASSRLCVTRSVMGERRSTRDASSSRIRNASSASSDTNRKTWAISSSAVSSERAPSRTVTVAIGSLLSARSTNELRPADIGEDQIQGTRVRLLLGEWTPEDTFAVALAGDRARICVTQAEIRREPLPFRFGPGQDFVCLMYCREEAFESGGIAPGPRA